MNAATIRELLEEAARNARWRAVHDAETRRARMFRPRPVKVTIWKAGPWGKCATCGLTTRALVGGHSHQHIGCAMMFDSRAVGGRGGMNRHDRKRAGVPRPPMGEEYGPIDDVL